MASRDNFPSCTHHNKMGWENLFDITQCLLLDQDLPGSLWRKPYELLAIFSASAQQNSRVVNLLMNISLARNWMCQDWIFGSTLLFETIPGKNKLDSRSRKCLYYLNANGKTKGYCCFHPTTRSVIVSKDIRSWGHTTIKDLSWSISHARTIKALPKRCQDSWHVYSHQRSNALHGTIYICHHRRPDESWCCESVCWLCL